MPRTLSHTAPFVLSLLNVCTVQVLLFLAPNLATNFAEFYSNKSTALYSFLENGVQIERRFLRVSFFFTFAAHVNLIDAYSGRRVQATLDARAQKRMLAGRMAGRVRFEAQAEFGSNLKKSHP